jgi:cyanophycinase
MTKNTFYQYFIIFFLATSCLHNHAPQNDDKSETIESSFVIGGVSRPTELLNRMIDKAGLKQGGYVIILPMASSLPDSAVIWSAEQFNSNGVQQVLGFNFETNEPQLLERIDSLKQASLIYISGGDQNKFMSIVGGTEIEKAIRYTYGNGAMIAGTSAGVAAMNQLMITGNELRIPYYSATIRTIESENLELAPGLGFIQSAIIDQHFLIRSRHNRLLTAIIENQKLKGIGIDESTAMLVRGNQDEVVCKAQVLVFSNPPGSHLEKRDVLEPVTSGSTNSLRGKNLNYNNYVN